jgi:lipopolysaccharide/colanic/teichoic acid biosynthesis glycosyltransferase
MIRLFDIIFSGFALVVIAPFMLPLVVLLVLTGEHDVLYRQIRIGRNGKPFYVLKFATMLRNSPNLKGGLITTKNDPRFLPLGKILRKTKINELPQLVNVFCGQMSVVGYRPFAESHYNLYCPEVKEAIGRIRPGLSGVGSIIFKNEEEILHRVADRDYVHDKLITPYKGRLETWYVENRSLPNYFIIIILTVLSFFKSDNRIIYRIFQDLPPCPPELEEYL